MAARPIPTLAVLALLALPATGPAAEGSLPDAERLRALMVRQVEVETVLTAEVTGVERLDPRVMAAMRKVPRHAFVPEPLRPHAYGAHPLPLGHDQNLTAPFLIGLMVHLAAVDEDSLVFETGTDTGYMAAVLGEIVREVYSTEIIAPLAEIAAVLIGEMGYDNVHVRAEDGYFGWPEQGPFDAIIVKEAIDHLPPPLVAQLRPGGRLVMPLGRGDGPQMLVVVTRREGGRLEQRAVLPVRFAPIQGGERT